MILPKSNRTMGNIRPLTTIPYNHRRKKKITSLPDKRFLSLLWQLGSLVLLVTFAKTANAMSKASKIELREDVRSMFRHAWDNYMLHAFPADEIKPISCLKNRRTRPPEPLNVGLNDVLGNFSLTAIDTLSTLGILASSSDEDKMRFWVAVEAIRNYFYGDEPDFGSWKNDHARIKSRKTIRAYKPGEKGKGFDIDSRVHVFETTIRILGGLLSGHLYAIGEFGGVYPPPQEFIVPTKGMNDFATSYLNATTFGAFTPEKPYRYTSHLLDLAHDLGERLLPAFTQSSSGIPFPRINLRHGLQFQVPPMTCQYSDMDAYGNCLYRFTREGKHFMESSYFFYRLHEPCDGAEGNNDHCWEKEETVEEPDNIFSTNPASAGSLVLEMTLLSRLTEDGRFEEVAKRAYDAVWRLRSGINLLGSTIVLRGSNGHPSMEGFSGIGAGLDSFYEYALKSYVFLSPAPSPSFPHEPYPNPQQQNLKFHQRLPLSKYFAANKSLPQIPTLYTPEYFLDVWQTSYNAIKRHIRRENPTVHYLNVNTATGAAVLSWIDSLSAYWPGNLVLSGDISEAESSHLFYTALWTRYSALPERWNIRTGNTDSGLGWWPGRPEFIESTYLLYQATKDPWYLYIGKMVLRDIQRRCWAPCGWTGLQDVTTGEKQDRSESFFLGETLQYLFLLFDEENELNVGDRPWVFTTEGHPVIIPTSTYKDKDTLVSQPHTISSLGKPPVCENPRQKRLLPHKSLIEAISAVSTRPDLSHSSYFTRLCYVSLLSPPTRVTLTSNSEDQFTYSQSQSYAGPSLNVFHFPWTLPKALVPSDGVCSLIPENEGFELQFPVLNPRHRAKSSSKRRPRNKKFSSSRNTNPDVDEISQISQIKGGIHITALEGLRIGLLLDDKNLFKISKVDNLLLGKDEVVYIERKAIEGLWDKSFELVYDPTLVNVEVELAEDVRGDGDGDGESTVGKKSGYGGGSGVDDPDSDRRSRGKTQEITSVLPKKIINMIKKYNLTAEQVQYVIDSSLFKGIIEKVNIEDLGDHRIFELTIEQIVNRLLEAGLDAPRSEVRSWDGVEGGEVKPKERTRMTGEQNKPKKDNQEPKDQNLIIATSSPPPLSRSSSEKKLSIRKSFPGISATGLGAIPIRSFVTDHLDQTPLSFSPRTNEQSPSHNQQDQPFTSPSTSSYKTFHFASYSCNPSQLELDNNHEVIFILRGYCRFSDKITSIPDTPSTKLLIIIDQYPDSSSVVDTTKLRDYSWPAYRESGLTRPFLDEFQMDALGRRRRNDVGMVMIGGGMSTYEGLRRWVRSVEVKRRWGVNVGGLPVGNVVVI